LVLFFSFCLCALPSIKSIDNKTFKLVDLKTEHLENPIGIDTSNPRLTWRMDDSTEGAQQKAYRLIVGVDSIAVFNGKGDMWDSGKIDSDLSLVTYDGNNLKPFTKYYWKVITWNGWQKQGSSDVASFETGMMKSNN